MNEELYNRFCEASLMLKKLNELYQNRVNCDCLLQKRKDKATHSGAYAVLAFFLVFFIVHLGLIAALYQSPGFWVYLAIVGIPFAIWAVYSLKTVISKKVREEDENGIKECEDKLRRINEEIEATFDLSKIDFIPDEYHYDIAVDYMKKSVFDGRSETVKEALDRYDEQMHRWKMENMQEKILAAQQEQLKQLNDLKAINFATGVGVWMNN